jgi:hypothetical protein
MGATYMSHGPTRKYALGLSVARNAKLNGHPGLARSMDYDAQRRSTSARRLRVEARGEARSAEYSAAQCCGQTFPCFRHPASHRKPVVCRSLANPARRMRRALVCTPRHMTPRDHLETTSRPGATIVGNSSDNSYMVLSSTCVDGTGGALPNCTVKLRNRSMKKPFVSINLVESKHSERNLSRAANAH